MSYETLSREFNEVPTTWLPGLLQRLIRVCSIKPVFKNKEAFLRFCEKSWDMNGAGLAELRETDGKP